jgi:uridylate kinase
VLYSELEFRTCIEKNLRVMDSTAISHCMEHNMPLMVFNFRKDGNIIKAVLGEKVGTIVSNNPSVAK